MPERDPGIGLRALFGVLGAIAVVTGGAVGAIEIRVASRSWPNWPALAAAAFCAVIVWGGVRLLGGAVRGRIAVRRNRPHGSIH